MKRKVALTRREPQRKLPTKTFRRRPSHEDLPTKIKGKDNNEDDKASWVGDHFLYSHDLNV